MRPLLAVLVVAAPLAASDLLPNEAQGFDWQGRFPANITVESKDLTVAEGLTVRVVTARATDPKSGAAFAVTVADYPPAFADVPADVLLDGVRDGLKGRDGRVKDDDRLRGPLPGRAVRVEAGRNLLRGRLVLDGTRLFQVTVAGPLRTFPDKLADQFFATFEPTR